MEIVRTARNPSLSRLAPLGRYGLSERNIVYDRYKEAVIRVSLFVYKKKIHAFYLHYLFKFIKTQSKLIKVKEDEPFGLVFFLELYSCL